MCRLYGLRANEPTRVECALVRAQNALLAQSRRDRQGGSHNHGWGIATYDGPIPHIDRQAWAAYHGEHFRRSAERAYAATVLAHVRHATIGGPTLENTHPFAEGRWSFVHNGTIPRFPHIRPRMLSAMSFRHRAAIRGETDSEHVFRLLMTLHDAHPGRPLLDTLLLAVHHVLAWCAEEAEGLPIGLNVMVTNGVELAGTRLGRSLHFVERHGVDPCPICGNPHVIGDEGIAYRAVEVASEPITEEAWRELPERSAYAVGPDYRLHVEPIAVPAG
jgi:glutamine amidotransferase